MARNYVEMTAPEIALLPREKTVFFMPVSPIEVHGPHLPLGTDVLVAQEVQRRLQAELSTCRADLTLVNLPPLYCGSDALPCPGSLSVQASGLSWVLYDFARGLSRQGFRYLVISDNHGGPRHHLAIDAAARKAWRKLQFYLIDPFIEIFRQMVSVSPALREETGLASGACGDDTDSHAGTNETSLFLAIAGETRNREEYAQIPPSTPSSPSGPAKLVSSVGRLVSRLGGPGADLEHLARMLQWTGQKGFRPYLGAPAAASPEAGEAMLRYHVKIAMSLVDRALSGEPALPRPILGWLAFLRRLPE
ncbi:MAG: creatininase family protein [Bacillota bacterium]